jgi:hypothetical protein
VTSYPSAVRCLVPAILIALAQGACGRASTPPDPAAAPSFQESSIDLPGALVASPAPARAPAGFLKGQLHLHSNASGDSDTPPDQVRAWYAARGYDFIVFTDHNRITAMADAPEGMLVLPGVELTQNLRSCEPAPLPGDACLLHVNALFVAGPADGPLLPAQALWIVPRRDDIYARGVDAARALGGIAQLNHPNFQRGADLEILMTLARRGLTLVEIANQAVDSDNEGGAGLLSTEALWDAALTRGARVFGTATDDAHHYDDAAVVRARGEIAYTGDRGFVMVRADRTAASIRAAVARGDFYSSTGVLLDQLQIGPEEIAVDVHADMRAEGAAPVAIDVIGTGGAVLERVAGPRLRFDPRRAPAGYVRVRVTAAGRMAWTQPLWTTGASQPRTEHRP